MAEHSQDCLGLCVCGTDCDEPDWHYVTWVLQISAAAWVATLVAGLRRLRESASKDMEPYKQKMQVRHGSLISVLAYLMSFLSFVQCCVFMSKAVSGRARMWGWIIELIACVLMLIDSWFYFVISFLTSFTAGMRYMLTRGIFDCVMPSSVLCMAVFFTESGKKTWLSFGFLSAVYFRLAARDIMDLWRMDFMSLKFQVLWSFVSIFSAVFASAMGMMVLENLGDPSLLEGLNKGRWNVLSATYFVVQTITTVGYGDLSPETSLGRICTIVGLFGGFGALVTISQQVLKVVSLNQMGGGVFTPPARCHHVVVAGNPTSATAIDFILEVFHEDHADDAEDLKLVFLVPRASSTAFISRVGAFLKRKSNVKIAPRVTLLCGNAVEPADIHRAGCAQAAALFVFPDSRTQDPTQEDTENIIRMMAIRRVVKHLRMILVLLKAEHESLLRESGVRTGALLTVLAVDQFKFELVGKTCQVPGLSTLICNLCKTTGETPEEVQALQPVWQQEYDRGSGAEIYEVDLSLAYCQRHAHFIDVMEDVLALTNQEVYLIGLVETRPNGEKKIMVNPGPRFQCKHPSTGILVAGIFIADARDSIKQCESSSDYAPRTERMMKREADADAAFMEGMAQTADDADAKTGKSNYLHIDESLLAGEGMTVAQQDVARDLVRLASHQRRGNQPARPPLKLLAKGGHVVLLCVGVGQYSESNFRLGVEHFVAPLRASHLQIMPPILVMAICPPKDWYNTINYKKVFFLRGSPLSVFDLERANVKSASAVFICHAGAGSEAHKLTENWMADSEVICATRLVEAQLGKGSATTVITELNCDSNHQFIQLPSLADADEPKLEAQPSNVFDRRQSTTNFDIDLNALSQVQVQEARPLAMTTDTADSSGRRLAVRCRCGCEFVQDSKFCHRCGKQRAEIEPPKEKKAMSTYQADKMLKEMSEAQEYFKQPRYACAQLFVGSVVTSLAANTFFNPTLTDLVSLMVSAKVVMMPVGRDFAGKTYYDYLAYFLWHEKMYPIGIFRRGEMDAMASATKASDEDDEAEDDEKQVSMKKINYVYTAPPGSTVLRENDRVVCFGLSPVADKEMREEARAAKEAARLRAEEMERAAAARPSAKPRDSSPNGGQLALRTTAYATNEAGRGSLVPAA